MRCLQIENDLIISRFNIEIPINANEVFSFCFRHTRSISLHSTLGYSAQVEDEHHFIFRCNLSIDFGCDVKTLFH
jgi:hypothetical protein